jgi:hypothetical protein
VWAFQIAPGHCPLPIIFCHSYSGLFWLLLWSLSVLGSGALPFSLPHQAPLFCHGVRNLYGMLKSFLLGLLLQLGLFSSYYSFPGWSLQVGVHLDNLQIKGSSGIWLLWNHSCFYCIVISQTGTRDHLV